MSTTPSDIERPNLVGNPNLAGPVAANPTCVAPSTIHTVAHWYNPCAVAIQPVRTFGNEGRDQFYASGFANFDASVIKNTPIRENMNLELRTEFFDLFNHTNPAFPNFVALTGAAANPGLQNPQIAYNGAAGQITSTNGTSRQVQFVLKLLF